MRNKKRPQRVIQRNKIDSHSPNTGSSQISGQTDTSSQPTPIHQSRLHRSVVSQLYYLYSQFVMWFIFQHFRIIRHLFHERIITWVFRLFTLLSFYYLVYDRFYETTGSISVTGADPADPYRFPFAFTNQSHMFTLKTISWKCNIIRTEYEGDIIFANVKVVGHGIAQELQTGGVINITCRTPAEVNQNMIGGVIEIETDYYVSVLGLFELHRTPKAVKFTWITSATEERSQWIKGEF
jgi:hypothetical protein